MSQQRYRFNDAISDPRKIFGSPENLLSDPRLDRSAKLAILRRWRQDAKALSVAENEGMIGGEPSMLHRIQQAIIYLTDGQGR